MLTIASHRRVVRTEYGVLHLGERRGDTQRVTGFEEKPEIPYVVSMGVYVLEPRAARLHRGRASTSTCPTWCCGCSTRASQVGSYLFDGYWLDIGRHEDYEKAIDRVRTAARPDVPARTGIRGTLASEPHDPVSVTVTGGAGYVGALAGRRAARGRAARCAVLDVLLHGQEDIASELEGRAWR